MRRRVYHLVAAGVNLVCLCTQTCFVAVRRRWSRCNRWGRFTCEQFKWQGRPARSSSCKAASLHTHMTGPPRPDILRLAPHCRRAAAISGFAHLPCSRVVTVRLVLGVHFGRARLEGYSMLRFSRVHCKHNSQTCSWISFGRTIRGSGSRLAKRSTTTSTAKRSSSQPRTFLRASSLKVRHRFISVSSSGCSA